jgi:hypothetical protein
MRYPSLFLILPLTLTVSVVAGAQNPTGGAAGPTNTQSAAASAAATQQATPAATSQQAAPAPATQQAAPAATPQESTTPAAPGRMPRRGGRMGFRGAAGQIAALGPDSLTLKTADGGAAIIKFDSSTQFIRDMQPAKLADFKVGEWVFAGGTREGDTWKAARLFYSARMNQRMAELGKTFIAGRVESISGTTLTIHRIDGQRQQIQVDENTSFRQGQASITLADVKPGDSIGGRGALSNGVFTVTTLNDMGARGFGAGRPDRRAGRRPGAGPGSAGSNDAPTGPPPAATQPTPPPLQ